MGLQHLSRELAARVMERCELLGQISDEPDRRTRTFLSPAMRRANDAVAAWMREGNLQVRQDAMSNIFGRLPCPKPGAKTLLLGSHLDTVRDAGKYDGPLGVLVALACLEQLKSRRTPLPFHVDVVGFADEEGVRYQSTYLGSRALAGTLSAPDLNALDQSGIALRNSGIGDVRTARLNRRDLIGYAEVHIEQGPVLEREGLGIGVVSAISGQTRARVEFTGRAAHAGTTPMTHREDALCAAAQFVLGVEKRAVRGFLATVGRLEVCPGSSNVVPGHVWCTVDVRHELDQKRIDGCRELRALAHAVARQRKLHVKWTTVQETPTVRSDPSLSKILCHAVATVEDRVLLLPSGAGHDAAALATLCPVAMLFVRCKNGISHHPAESVRPADVARAISALTDFVGRLASQHE